MKIAIVTETFLPSTDGIVTRLTESIRWLLREGHDVLIIAPALGITEFEGARVAGVPAYRFFLYKSKSFAFPGPLVGRLLKEFGPDLVHVVNPAVLGAAGIFYGQKWPLVASYHTRIPEYADYYNVSFFKPLLWGYLRLLHNRAQLNLCTSQTVLEELEAKKFNNVKLWTRGVALEKFGPERRSPEMRGRLSGGHPDKTLLLFVGRLAPEKEIERIRRVLETSDDFCLAIAGDGPHRRELESHFAGTRTVFAGFLHGEELSAAYASCDLFVFPSTTETLGLVLLEAMASGTAVVAADSGPTREQVEHGETGLLYDPGRPDSLTECVWELRDEQRRRQIGETARKRAEAFGWDKPSRQLFDFYREVLAGQPAGQAAEEAAVAADDRYRQ